jgi:hypothetical protein
MAGWIAIGIAALIVLYFWWREGPPDSMGDLVFTVIVALMIGATIGAVTAAIFSVP